MEAIKRLVNYVIVEESFNKQKSKEQDITLGDGKIEYFFRSVQVREIVNKSHV